MRSGERVAAYGRSREPRASWRRHSIAHPNAPRPRVSLKSANRRLSSSSTMSRTIEASRTASAFALDAGRRFTESCEPDGLDTKRLMRAAGGRHDCGREALVSFSVPLGGGREGPATELWPRIGVDVGCCRASSWRTVKRNPLMRGRDLDRPARVPAAQASFTPSIGPAGKRRSKCDELGDERRCEA